MAAATRRHPKLVLVNWRATAQDIANIHAVQKKIKNLGLPATMTDAIRYALAVMSK